MRVAGEERCMFLFVLMEIRSVDIFASLHKRGPRKQKSEGRCDVKESTQSTFVLTHSSPPIRIQHPETTPFPISPLNATFGCKETVPQKHNRYHSSLFPNSAVIPLTLSLFLLGFRTLTSPSFPSQLTSRSVLFARHHILPYHINKPKTIT